jgi:signal transduction histidine kinase
VIRCLEIISEASRRLPEALKDRHPSMPWKEMAGAGNIYRQDAVEIVVADEGGGIDPAMLPSLFRFGASNKGDRGNGMGLWVVKQLVEKHGGSIDIDTRLGEGTRFTIVWPRQFPATRGIDEAIATPLGQQLRGSET